MMPSDGSGKVRDVDRHELKERHRGVDRSQSPPAVLTLCQWSSAERVVGTLSFDVASLRYELSLPGRRVAIPASHRRLDDLDAARPDAEPVVGLAGYRAARERWTADLDRALALTYPAVCGTAVALVREAIALEDAAATG